MTRSILLAACSAAMLAACGAEQGAGDDIHAEFDARLAQVVIPEDKHAFKPPGCPTLVKMGQFNGMSRYRGDVSGAPDEVLVRLGEEAFPSAGKVAMNRLTRNDCEVVTLHAKGLDFVSNGPKEVIRIALIEEGDSGRQVVAVGQKFLCYGEANPMWRAEACEQE